ncbi:cyclic nucleotide-binding domain-containing protein [Pedobacter sp. HMF7647]|uniref:Cyclic nucleotide-binding domain-containing protein n=1 Tax=Hufsiella arboris TaxID=2695275 RepID=A0A7K1YCW2_9SPHI|nr:Crp/Fnr family transcriptional regulator [Hufsiella arboris]MXV52426.1 cyclic nucleotide-binding domain-containing protein [Hufsiella arboris]
MLYPEILTHIARYVQLTTGEQHLLCGSIETIKLKKKEFLLEPGKHCKGSYFIIKGCTRQYFVNKKLNEQIIQFGLENWWIADQDSLLNKQPSSCYIQAIEDCELLLINEKDKDTLFKQIPTLESYFRIMMQKSYVAAQRRIGFIFTQSDEERYRQFTSLYPDFVQRVPQYMLASYLGFTPQFLSRLRAKKA